MRDLVRDRRRQLVGGALHDGPARVARGRANAGDGLLRAFSGRRCGHRGPAAGDAHCAGLDLEPGDPHPLRHSSVEHRARGGSDRGGLADRERGELVAHPGRRVPRSGPTALHRRDRAAGPTDGRDAGLRGALRLEWKGEAFPLGSMSRPSAGNEEWQPIDQQAGSTGGRGAPAQGPPPPNPPPSGQGLARCSSRSECQCRIFDSS